MLLSKYPKISYEDLNAKQKEKYNYQKVSAILADYGFITIPLSDDWNGADFLAVHRDGDTLKVQLKGRMTLSRDYVGKDLYVCFRDDNEEWYLYHHDTVLHKVLSSSSIGNSKSWKDGLYTFPGVSQQNKELLKEYQIPAASTKSAA